MWPKVMRKVQKSWFPDVLLVVVLIGGAWILNSPESFGEIKSTLFPLFSQFEGLLNAFSEWSNLFSTWLTVENILIAAAALGLAIVFFRRLIWRLRQNKVLTSTSCPKCEQPLQRISRTPIQKFISKYIPLRRFRCPKCRWKGVRLKAEFPGLKESESTRAQAKVELSSVELDSGAK